MRGITNGAFRAIISQYSHPDVIFTEFANVETLFSPGKDAEMVKLTRSSAKCPVVAQLWGSNPENFMKSARILSQRGFSGIDINMGCSINKILKKDSCGSLIKNPNLAREIIIATKEGAAPLPVSVKTRLGHDAFSPQWIEWLLQSDIDALTIHGRTVVQGFRGSADWTSIGKAVEIKKQLGVSTCIIGNGDVKSRVQGIKRAKHYEVDGIMIGRAVLSDVFVFSSKSQDGHEREARLRILSEHIDRVLKEKRLKDDDMMKKFYKVYVRNFDGAGQLRERLMKAGSLEEAKAILAESF